MKDLKDIDYLNIGKSGELLSNADHNAFIFTQHINSLNESLRELQTRMAFSDKMNGLEHEGDEPFERSYTVAELRTEVREERRRYAIEQLDNLLSVVGSVNFMKSGFDINTRNAICAELITKITALRGYNQPND